MISIILLLVDGFLFGLAVKKAIISIILVVVGIVLAGMIGLSIPSLGLNSVWTHVANIFASQVHNIGGIFYAFPVFWVIGFALGLWKG